MSKVQRKNLAENKRARKMRRAERFYRAQRSTSIYFLLWTVFTVLSLFIVLFSGKKNFPSRPFPV